jgi:hypothetical protein
VYGFVMQINNNNNNNKKGKKHQSPCSHVSFFHKVLGMAFGTDHT